MIVKEIDKVIEMHALHEMNKIKYKVCLSSSRVCLVFSRLLQSPYFHVTNFSWKMGWKTTAMFVLKFQDSPLPVGNATGDSDKQSLARFSWMVCETAQ